MLCKDRILKFEDIVPGEGICRSSKISKSKLRNATVEGVKIALKETPSDHKYGSDIVAELDNLKSLDHANIVKHLGIFQESEDNFFWNIYFALELCDVSLNCHEVFKNEGKDKEVVMDFVRQMSGATEYMVANDIIHGDIKPSHILIKDSVYKLTGFEKVLYETGTENNKRFLFTHYMAPERISKCPRNVTERRKDFQRVDSWSIGVVTFEFVMGKYPESVNKDMKTRNNALEEEVHDKDLQFIIRFLLTNDPLARLHLHELMTLHPINKTVSTSHCPQQLIRCYLSAHGMIYNHPGENNCKGHVLIINNYIFDDGTDLENREGSQEDVKKLRVTLESFSFDVSVEENKTAAKMAKTIQNFLSSLETTVILVLMSHGEIEGVWGTDGVCLSIRDHVLPLLSNAGSPKLINKLKVVINCGCRGKPGKETKKMKKSQIESIDGLIGNDSGRADAAEYSELLLIFSTMASYASNRNKKKGTWFIRAFCSVLSNKKLTNNFGIYHLLCEVCQELTKIKHEDGENITQIYEYHAVGMTKDYYFPPRTEKD